MKFEGPRMTRAFVFSVRETAWQHKACRSHGDASSAWCRSDSPLRCCGGCVALDLYDQTYMMGSAGGEPARSSQDDLPGDADGLEEGAIVADDQQGAVIGAQPRLDGGDSVDVEVVGGFIEDQEFRRVR